MKLKITWNEYKAFANKAIKEKYPKLVDDDTVKFMKSYGYEPDGPCYELPEYVELGLDD
jgi:hypothetical protein